MQLKISPELRAEAGRQNIKYTHLAQKLGTTRQAVSEKLRNDATNYSISELAKYAEALSISTSELLRRAEENKNNRKESVK